MKKIYISFITLSLLYGTESAKAQGLFQNILENTQIRFFGSTEYSAVLKDTTNKFSHQFQVGDMEMLLTSQISEKISILAEPIFTIDNGLEVNRFMIKYSVEDYFNISTGKLYTPIGIWNNTFYHQARVLLPTIDHPAVIADESDFGVLNNKDIGVQFSGDNISNIRLGYKLMAGNGNTSIKTPGMAVTGNVFIEPIDNLKFAVSGQFEKLPAGSMTKQGMILAESNTLNLYNASVMYYGPGNKFEFASEYYRVVTNSASIGSTAFNAFFAYAGYRLKKFTPYVMYNRLNYDNNIQYFAKNNFSSATLGLRYNITALAVIKVEGQYYEADSFKKLGRIEVQFAIGF